MLALASDHGGFQLKEGVAGYLGRKGIAFHDYGTYTEKSVDYPSVIKEACMDIQAGRADMGIFICGTGVGISIAANKYNGIRAACVSEAFSAALAREHNDANVLCLGGRILASEYAFSIIDAFLNTGFSGGERHILRIAGIKAIEESQNT